MQRRFGLSSEAWRILPFCALTISVGLPYLSYWNNYLSLLGFSTGDIGLLSAVPPLIAIAFQPLMGLVGDRIRYKNTLVYLLGAGMLLSMAGLWLGTSFGWVFLMMALFSVCNGGVGPIADTMALEVADRSRSPYGPIRMAGAVLYMLLAPILGALIADRYERTPLAVAALVAACLLAALLAPRVGGHARRAGAPINPFAILKNPVVLPMMLLIAGIYLFSGPALAFSSLFAVHQFGASSAFLGWSSALGCVLEIPFLFFFDRLYARWGADRMVVAGGLGAGLRVLALGLWPTPYVFLGGAVFGSAFFAMHTQGVYRIVSCVAPPQMKASAIFTIAVATGAARSLGVFVCGRLLLVAPYASVWIIAGTLAFLCSLAFAILFRCNAPLRRKIREASGGLYV